jgi:hypothetical protein
VLAHNLDKVHLKLKAAYGAVLRSVSILCPDTLSTMFLLSSPQFLATHSDLTAVLSRQARKRVIWFVIIDNFYLHVQQGTTFRKDICKLTTSFLSKVFSKSMPIQNPKSILATNTMRYNCIPLAASLAMLRLPPTVLL